jgi:hypothetical protein
MEGKDYEFDIFNNIFIEEMDYNVFPFNNFEENLDNSISNSDFLDLLNIDFKYPDMEYKVNNSQEQIIDKLSKIEENYNNIYHNNIVSPATTSKLYIFIQILKKK